MQNSDTMNRRRFLGMGLLGSTAVFAANFGATVQAAVTKAERDPSHGLKLGVTSYTFRKFSLDQAIAMTKEAGVKYISLKDMHLPMKTTPAERQQVSKKIEDAGLVLMGGGVIYLKNKEDEIHAAFEYAKDAGMPTIICSPDPEALDTVEKMAKQYDLRIAIHNHGPTDKKYPSPFDVWRLVKDRDARMGLCIDVGHTVRLGVDPVAAIEQCASRLYDFHIKDVTQPTPQGKEIEVGRGVIDIVDVLKTLIKVKYAYDVELEYEPKPDAPMPGIMESFGYLRGALAAI